MQVIKIYSAISHNPNENRCDTFIFRISANVCLYFDGTCIYIDTKTSFDQRRAVLLSPHFCLPQSNNKNEVILAFNYASITDVNVEIFDLFIFVPSKSKCQFCFPGTLDFGNCRHR